MAKSHMLIQNLILWKRYVRHLLFTGAVVTIEYVGGRKESFKLEHEPTTEEVAAYEAELEDRD